MYRHVLRLIAVIVSLGAGITAAGAEEAAVGSREVYWVRFAEVQPEKMDEFKALISRLVATVRANEPGALAFEWHVADDGRTVQVLERYRDSDAVVAHFADVAKTFGPSLRALSRTTAFYVYGAPNEAVKTLLAGLHPTYLTSFDGFTR